MRASGNGRSGMTLLEVVLALGILALGMGSILSMLAFGAALSSQAERRAGAAAALGAVLPDLEERLFPLLEDGTVGPPEVFEGRPVPNFPRYTHSVRAELAHAGSGGPELWTVWVSIEWLGRGARRSLDFRTLMPRAVPLGERLRRAAVGAPLSAAPATAAPAAPAATPNTAPSNEARR